MPKRKRTGLSSLGTLITAMSISLMACGSHHVAKLFMRQRLTFFPDDNHTGQTEHFLTGDGDAPEDLTLK